MIIGIDFDGTCVTHEFPKVGRDIGAIPILKELVKQGNQLILFTMRSDRGDDLYLTDAVNWFKRNDIELYGIQTNPGQSKWTSSPKAYCEMYIDDAALGCPLVYPHNGDKPYVDWIEVENLIL